MEASRARIVSEIDEMLHDVNVFIPQYASQSLKPGQTYKLTSEVYRLGDIGDMVIMLDIHVLDNDVGDDTKNHYVIMRYLTSSSGGVQEIVVKKWSSLDHTLMYSMKEIIEE